MSKEIQNSLVSLKSSRKGQMRVLAQLPAVEVLLHRGGLGEVPKVVDGVLGRIGELKECWVDEEHVGGLGLRIQSTIGGASDQPDGLRMDATQRAVLKGGASVMYPCK